MHQKRLNLAEELPLKAKAALEIGLIFKTELSKIMMTKQEMSEKLMKKKLNGQLK